MFTKQYVAVANLATDAKEFTLEKVRNEDGEIASWMIVLAFLVVAALAAKDQVGGAIEELVEDTADKIQP